MPTTADRPFAGRVALITGASRRIGRATALALAREGAAVVLNARAQAGEIAGVAREIEDAGGRAVPHLADVADEAAVAGMMDAAVARFGRLDILVNNAAIRRQSPFLEMTLAEWRAMFQVIVDGAFLCCRAAIPHMLKAGGGRIVNVGGVSAHTGVHHRAHVAAAKAALVGLTRALAVEFAGRGITVNCVVPGKIGGRRSATAGEAPPFPHDMKPLVAGEGVPEDVAGAILWLSLPSSRFVTGQTLHVSGGMFLP
jgi:3-oxoacyl-[acyl-carrier protein] reductase